MDLINDHKLELVERIPFTTTGLQALNALDHRHRNRL